MKSSVIKVAGVIMLLLLFVALPIITACSQPAPAPAPAPSPAPKPATSAAPAPAPSPAAKPTPSPATAPSPTPEKVQKYVSFISHGASGLTYFAAVAMASVISKFSEIQAITALYPGVAQWAPAMNAAAADAVWMSPYQPIQAYTGIGPFQGKEKVRFRSLGSATDKMSTVVAICTSKTTGIKSIADLRGKRVYADLVAWVWPAPIMDALLGANGMTRKDVTWLTFSDGDAAARDIIEGRADAMITLVGGVTMNMAESKPGLYLIPLNAKEAAAVETQVPPFAARTVKAGNMGVSADTSSVAADWSLIVRPGMNNLTGYTLTKTMFEHLPDLYKAHDLMTGITKDNVFIQWTFPYQDGAIKYYKEIGLWKPEHDAKQQKLLDEEKKIFGS